MMGRLLEKRWVCILLSVLLAIVFWAYIRAAVDPNGITSIHNVRVETTGTSVLKSQGLTISDISPQVVELRVEGSNSARTELLRQRNNLTVVVDVSRCVEGENTLKYRPSWPENFNEEGVHVPDQEPSSITVMVEKLYSKPFDVEFILDGKVVNKDYQTGTPAIEPASVLVSGPVEQVNQVAKAAVILKDNELDERFAGDLPITLLDSKGNPLTDLEVTLSSETAYVVVPVVMMKEVELTVNLLPGGGAIEDDAVWDIDPPTIVVSGSEADLEGLDEISLGSISLSDVVGTNTFTRPITLDPSLTNESGLTTATIKVTVEGLDTETFAVSNIRTVNLPEEFSQTELVTRSVQVKVRGPAEELEKIDASQLRVVADLSGVTNEGTQLIRARVYLDGSSTVGVIGEYTISVNISR